MSFKKLDDKDFAFMRGLFPDQQMILEGEKFERYGSDETEDLRFMPEAVVFPHNPEQVSELLAYCNEHKIPVTPRGAGTGLSGGSIPRYGGVSMSMEYMNRILKIDERNFQVTVEPGVITQVLQETVESMGLFYPPDPASRGSCFIGGNIAENSGGPKAVKYGVTNDYVLNLEVVLADGTLMWTGANVLKNATGYNLTQLIVGSEGTLGVITKAVLKLIPKPRLDQLLLVPFYSAEEACEAVAKIMQSGITPSGLEFMERDALEMAAEFLGEDGLEVKAAIEANLLIEVDGNDADQLMTEMEGIYKVLEAFKCGDILFADSQAQKERLWKMRRCLGEAVKSRSIYKEEDTVVPRAELPKLLKGVKEVGKKYGFTSVCYGHAGDGNLHVNILKDEMTDEMWNNSVKKAIREIFELCISLGGTISGEHGIGLVQREFMDIPFNPYQLNLQRSIKNLLDPNGILNPGKIF